MQYSCIKYISLVTKKLHVFKSRAWQRFKWGNVVNSEGHGTDVADWSQVAVGRRQAGKLIGGVAECDEGHHDQSASECPSDHGAASLHCAILFQCQPRPCQQVALLVVLTLHDGVVRLVRRIGANTIGPS